MLNLKVLPKFINQYQLYYSLLLEWELMPEYSFFLVPHLKTNLELKKMMNLVSEVTEVSDKEEYDGVLEPKL
jgi:hypothetical protein